MTCRRMVSVFLAVIFFVTCFVMCLAGPLSGMAEETQMEITSLYITANRLNGRSGPRKTSFIEAVFDNEDVLQCTGKFSKDHKWVEVLGGEGGTVWVDVRYVTERKAPFLIETYNPKVKIRSKPGKDGKVKGYLRKGKTIEIWQVVLGWGRCDKGWIDLSYCIEVEE